MKQYVKCPPPLDPGFEPASLCWRAHGAACSRLPDSREATVLVSRPNGESWSTSVPLLPDNPQHRPQNHRIVERVIKSLLWIQGGNSVHLEGASELADGLAEAYQPEGERAFDAEFMGQQCFGAPFAFQSSESVPRSREQTASTPHASQLDGCRVGFDLGGSDRKCAAVMDGEVVYSEEIKWDPYFQSDPEYHRRGILDTIRRAASKLPRVDAIGGSAAGIYIDNEPRVGSLFRGISKADFQARIRPVFHEIRASFGNIPFVVANDGDVTALAGSLATGKTGILGISMGTSQAAGYIDPSGNLTGWLNELAFVPVDFRKDAPVDEWSGDAGCGVQYFSQQAVMRLARQAGFPGAEDLPPPALLESVQEALARGIPEARAIFETIGTYFGYALAWYARFYEFSNVLTLGRVTSGEGGSLVVQSAKTVLESEFPELAGALHFLAADETTKRHGQAVAAASLPHIT